MTTNKVSEIIIENVLHFFVKFNIPIIHGLTLFCGFLLLAWWVRAFRSEGTAGGGPDLSSSQFTALEVTLKKFMDSSAGLVQVGASAANVDAAISAADVVPSTPAGSEEASGEGSGEKIQSTAESAPSAVVSEENNKVIDTLNTTVSTQATEIEALKTQLVEAAAGGKSEGGGAPDEDLLKKLEELEGKLLEYEIIEDDIADLSLYKEENAKLKEQLAGLDASGVAAPNNEGEASDDATKALESEASDLLNEFRDPEPAEPAVSETPEEPKPEEAAASVAPVAEAAVESPAEEASPLITDDLVSEFKKAMDSSDDAEMGMDVSSDVAAPEAPDTEEKEVEKEEAPAEAPTEPPPQEAVAEVPTPVEEPDPPTPAVAPAAPKEVASGPMETMEEDDILAEFTNESGQTESITKAVVTGIADAMTEPTSPPEVEVDKAKVASDEKSLSEIDTDKMLAEMDTLGDCGETEKGFTEGFDVDKMAEEAQKLTTEE